MSVFPSENSRKSQAAVSTAGKASSSNIGKTNEPMNRRVQIAVLVGLFALLPVVAYKELGSPTAKAVSITIGENAALLQVENPALRLDLLERLKKLEYHDTHRNIFSSSALFPARPAATPQAPVVDKLAPPAPPPGPPPLVVPAHFFGYVTDARTGVRRAFFKQDEDGYVLGVGELLAGRFRLVQIGDSTAELEETATGRRTTLPMEEEPAQPDQNQVAQVPAGVGSSPPGFRPAEPAQNQVGFAQVPTGAGPSPPGFRPTPFGQNPVGFPQMPIGGGPSPLGPTLGRVPAGMNPLR
jgi:hypothetical protein